MAQVKRETASICMVEDILNSPFVKTEGWNPSYFATSLGNISRMNILAVIVSKDEDGLFVDDGSGRILLRSFENNTFSDVNVGDFVTIIGRPRIYNEQKYILPEIMKQIDPAWAEYRKLQVEIQRRNVPERKVENKVKIVEMEPATPQVNAFQRIVEFIRDLDIGNGADSDAVAKRSGIPNAEEVIRKLLEEGEIFEIRPGKLKILE